MSVPISARFALSSIAPLLLPLVVTFNKKSNVDDPGDHGNGGQTPQRNNRAVQIPREDIQTSAAPSMSEQYDYELWHSHILFIWYYR